MMTATDGAQRSPGYPAENLPESPGDERGEVENDAEGIRTMKVLGQNMAWLLQRVAETKTQELVGA